MTQKERSDYRGLRYVAILLSLSCFVAIIQSMTFMMHLPSTQHVSASHNFQRRLNQSLMNRVETNLVTKTREQPFSTHTSQQASTDNTCKPINSLNPVRERADLGMELKRLGFSGIGVELGVQQGVYSQTLLNGWQQAQLYVQVDLWQEQHNYKDSANVNNDLQSRYMHDSLVRGQSMVEKGYAKKIKQCQNFTTICASQFDNNSLDFVYVDARHDRSGVLEDLATYWPKLREGGLFAGHDYVEQPEIAEWERLNKVQPKFKQDWTVNFDGTRDGSGRVLRGAVDDFFGGVLGIAPPDLRTCPLQVVVTYWENNLWSSWMVRKPAGSAVCKPMSAIAPIRRIADIGKELKRLGLTGDGVEVGVCNGSFTSSVLGSWKQAGFYTQIDLWPQEHGFVEAVRVGESMTRQGFAKQVRQCRDRPEKCIAKVEDSSLDFVYINFNTFVAQGRSEQYRVILEALRGSWPKVREGGILAGSSFDGARDTIGRIVKHVVNDFFGGQVVATDDLQQCPRQVTITYRERGEWTTWLVRK